MKIIGKILGVFRYKPVTLLVLADACLGIAAAFGLFGVDSWDGTQWTAVQALFTALGAKATTMVTANARLTDEVVAEAKDQAVLGEDVPPAEG